jgi:sigma-B regulation protein RsbU (phosphoserine phosphatase)
MSDYLASFKERNKNLVTNDENINQRLMELSALFEISQTLNSSLNLPAILNNILLVPMGRMMIGKGIVILKSDNKKYKVETVKGVPQALYDKEISLTDLPDHPFMIKNVNEEKEWLPFFQNSKIELIIPFIAHTDFLGLMGFGGKINGESYSEDEIEFLSSLGNIASTSIENALIFDKINSVNRELDQKIQELNTLFDIGKELNLTLEKEKILKLLTYALMGQLMVNNFIIVLKEKDDYYAEIIKGKKFIKIEKSYIEDLCLHSHFLNTPYICQNDSDYDILLNEMGIHLVIPMQLQNVNKGYIFLADKITKNRFTTADCEFLQTLGNIAIVSLEHARLFQEMLEKHKLEEEIKMARNIQNRLLPKSMPIIDHLDIHGINVPSKQVGGDYFDIIMIGDDKVGLAIADVSGKGMPASLLMSNLQASLHSLVYENYPLDKLVQRINNVIYHNTDPDKFITFFFAQLYLPTLQLDYVNAGHNPPLVVHKNGKIDKLEKGGLLLGVMPEITFECGLIKLEKNDTIILYTDGVTETMNADEEEYEEKRLIEFMKKNYTKHNACNINEMLISDLHTYAGHMPQMDDITILTLKVS